MKKIIISLIIILAACKQKKAESGPEWISAGDSLGKLEKTGYFKDSLKISDTGHSYHDSAYVVNAFKIRNTAVKGTHTTVPLTQIQIDTSLSRDAAGNWSRKFYVLFNANNRIIAYQKTGDSKFVIIDSLLTIESLIYYPIDLKNAKINLK